MQHQLTLTLLPDRFAVCRLDANDVTPEWAQQGLISSITRTPEELSIVCAQDLVPSNVTQERDWCYLQVRGPLDFSMVGVLSSLVEPLANVGISVFVISTFDTDYLLVKDAVLELGVARLNECGHRIVGTA